MTYTVADIIYKYQFDRNKHKRYKLNTGEVISYSHKLKGILVAGTELTYMMNSTDILTAKATEYRSKQMTLSDIEEELGCEIELIEEEA